METLFELLHKRQDLPKGNVYKKKIKNSFYYYYQYRENNKNYTEKIDKEKAILLLEKIAIRKEIEIKIKKILAKGNKDIELSKTAREYTGYIMSFDTVVAEFEKGILISKDDKLCPIVIKNTQSIVQFLKSRSIDCGRTNSRLLRKVLNIKETDETLISLCSYAASITDNYWFKPKHSKLKYVDIAFNNDIFFDTALKGVITLYPNRIILTPELTTNGSYEKGWRNMDGEWWLFKSGTINERYSEMVYSRLFEKLGLPTAHYELDGPYIKTKNFVMDKNFEPMISIVGENEDIEFVYNKLDELNHQLALDYLRLVTFDVILNNVDRHNENCGILRDRHTGEIICLAPNYDNNMSLISRDISLPLNKNEGFLSMFLKCISSNKDIKKALKEIEFPFIDEKILLDVCESIDLNIDIDVNQIIKYIMFRYNAIMNQINK